MPKKKIDVNENLNVSIGELFKITEETLHSKQESNINNSENTKLSPEKDANQLNIDNSDIKKMIPKFGKISLQHQRAGRGGRTVTLVSISGETELKPESNLALLKELKKSLGCGGQMEEGKIVLHGEIADRVSEWFIKMGAKKVKY